MATSTATKTETQAQAPTNDEAAVQTVKVFTAVRIEAGKVVQTVEKAKLKDAYNCAMDMVRKLRDSEIPMKRGGIRGVGREWNGIKDDKIFSVKVGASTKEIKS